MSNSTQLTECPAIEYPDDNGEPMAENTLQFQWIVIIKEGLEALFLPRTQRVCGRRLALVSRQGRQQDPQSPRRDGGVWPAQGIPGLLQAVGGRESAATGRL